MHIDFPIWFECICVIVWIVFMIFIIRGVYRNYLKNIFCKRRVVPAELVSKVKEEYYERKVYANCPGAGIKSPDSGLHMGNMGIAYRLYFNVGEKKIELDVDQGTYDSLPDSGKGMLEYRGNMFYEFSLSK